PDAGFVAGLIISDQALLPNILSRIARLTVDHASDFLKGNNFSFAQLEKLRNKESSEFELASQLRHARSIIDTAWPARDYRTIVKVLEPLEKHLSPA
ncbi:MAG: hypothetical protein L0Y39_01070, partial [Methylococcaceae bacterium]|nr:hypothetical protein [Methylococcaceae bacterium]